jgi:hypothetical protein
MQIGFYRALVGVGVSETDAEHLVAALEKEMDKRVDYGVNAVRADIAALAGQVADVKAEVSRVEDKIINLRWYIGGMVTIAAVAIGVVLHFVH